MKAQTLLHLHSYSLQNMHNCNHKPGFKIAELHCWIKTVESCCWTIIMITFIQPRGSTHKYMFTVGVTKTHCTSTFGATNRVSINCEWSRVIDSPMIFGDRIYTYMFWKHHARRIYSLNINILLLLLTTRCSIKDILLVNFYGNNK